MGRRGRDDVVVEAIRTAAARGYEAAGEEEKEEERNKPHLQQGGRDTDDRDERGERKGAVRGRLPGRRRRACEAPERMLIEKLFWARQMRSQKPRKRDCDEKKGGEERKKGTDKGWGGEQTCRMSQRDKRIGAYQKERIALLGRMGKGNECYVGMFDLGVLNW